MSFIRKITIERFKSIKHLELQLKPVNIMIGVNGAGKSNFIKFFKLLDVIASGRDLGNYVEAQCGGANKLLYCGAKYSQNIFAYIEFARKKNLEIKLQYAVPNRIVFDNTNHFNNEEVANLLGKLKVDLNEVYDAYADFECEMNTGDKSLLKKSLRNRSILRERFMHYDLDSSGNNSLAYCRILISELKKNKYLATSRIERLCRDLYYELKPFLNMIEGLNASDSVNILDRAIASVLKIVTELKQLIRNSMSTEYMQKVRSIAKDKDIIVIHLNDTSDGGPLLTGTDYLQSDQLYGDGRNVAIILAKLAKNFPEIYNKIQNEVKRIMPDFDSFVILDYEDMVENIGVRKISHVIKWRHKYIDIGDDHFGPQDFSDGSIRYIVLLVALLLPKTLCPKLLIIDEPELGLHPQAIKRLSQFIKLASENMQIIISTQSSDLLNCFGDDVSQVITVEKRDQESVFKQFGKTEVKELEKWLLEYSGADGSLYTLSDLWHMNKLGANR